jgi:hypothetical protein
VGRDLRHAQPPIQLSPPHRILFHLDRVFTEQDLLLGVQGVGGPFRRAVTVGVAGSDDCRDGDEQPRVSLSDILVILLYRGPNTGAKLTGGIIPNHLASRLALSHSDDRREL